jgi:hypothetical protein
MSIMMGIIFTYTGSPNGVLSAGPDGVPSRRLDEVPYGGLGEVCIYYK